MRAIDKEVAELSLEHRLAGLRRIIPVAVIKQALDGRDEGRSAGRRLPKVFMMQFLLAMGFYCTDCYRQVFRWMRPWKAGDIPERSTFCEARKRVGTAPFVRLAASTVKLLADEKTPGAFYRGKLLMAIDGFVVNLPDTPENERVFGRPKNGRGDGAFPQARVVGLCEAATHVLWRWLIKPQTCAETVMADRLLKDLKPNMLLLWDRGFLSYERVKAVIAAGADLLARGKTNLIFEPIRQLSDGSYLAKIYPDAAARRHDCDGIVVRIIDYTFDDPGRPGNGQKHRLLTTLLDEKLDPATTLIELYHVRWEEELAIDEVKTHELERTALRSQTPAGVVQELYGLLIDHFIVRTLMNEAARSIEVSPLRLSFTATLKILRCRIPECPKTPWGRTRWWMNLLQEIAEEKIEARRNRINPRVIKRTMSKWKKKRREHRAYPQPTKTFLESIVMLG
jgi:hypothetical protein